jgi:RecA/RadA recombinase
MATKKVVKEEPSLNDIMSDFMGMSKKVDKNITSYGSTLKDSFVSNIDEWIDTGSYALNRLISGNIYKGVPKGRIVAFSGPSGTGKSFTIGRIIANAQKLGYLPIFYDSENAVDSEFLENLGVNTENMLYFPVTTFQELRNHAMVTIEEFKVKYPGQKVMLILDSFSNLSSAKEMKDTMVDKKTNSDMGERAKAGGQMMTMMNKFCGKHGIPFLFSAHSYKDTASAPQPQYAKTIMSGGQRGTYISSAVIMLTKKHDKDKTTKEVKGNIMVARSEKNRLCKDQKKVECYISFESGPNKYYGLEHDCVEAGLFTKVDSLNFIVKHLDQKIRINKLFNSKVFTKELLDELNEFCIKKYRYAKIDMSKSEDELDEELEAIENEIDEDDEL